jgi:hypothetical protein
VSVISFAAAVLELRGEDAALTIDAQRLVSRQPGLFSPIRANTAPERYPNARELAAGREPLALDSEGVRAGRQPQNAPGVG